MTGAHSLIDRCCILQASLYHRKFFTSYFFCGRRKKVFRERRSVIPPPKKNTNLKNYSFQTYGMTCCSFYFLFIYFSYHLFEYFIKHAFVVACTLDCYKNCEIYILPLNRTGLHIRLYLYLVPLLEKYYILTHATRPTHLYDKVSYSIQYLCMHNAYYIF